MGLRPTTSAGVQGAALPLPRGQGPRAGPASSLGSVSIAIPPPHAGRGPFSSGQQPGIGQGGMSSCYRCFPPA